MADAWQSAWVEVLPDFKNFKSKANSEMSSVLGSAGTAGGVVAGNNLKPGILGGIKGMAAPILGAIAALGIGKLVGDAIGAGIRYSIDSVGLASDLAETRAAIGEVFGDAGADIEAFAENANKQLGQTRIEALRGAQTFGVFARSAGLTGKPLSQFSTDLSVLSADLASFYNADPSEVIDALGAGLRGESEPLRRFGVLLDDATLKSRAMALGIYDGSGALSQQQRILAAQAEIFAQTGVAQGDFARTSDGLANQQRILAASLADTQTQLGEYLLPVFNEMASFANETLVPALGQIIDKVGPILGTALTDASPKVQELLDKMIPLAESFITAAAEDGIPAMITALDEVAENAPEWIEAFQQVDQAVVDLDREYKNFLQDTRNQRLDRIAWLDDIMREFGNFFITIDGEMDNWNADMKQWGNDLTTGFANGIREGQSKVLGAAIQMAAGAVAGVKDLLKIKSPSRVFAEIGGYMAEGMAVGIDGKKSMVDSAVNSLVTIPTISGQVGSLSSGGTAAGGPVPAVTQYITVRDEDPRHFGRAMGRELIREMAGN